MSNNESVNLSFTKEQITNLILSTNWMIEDVLPKAYKKASGEAKERLLERLEKYKVLKKLLQESVELEDDSLSLEESTSF